MARIGVPHTVPVSVVVDTETGTVERVVIHDEEATLLEEGSWSNLDRDDNEVSPEEEFEAKSISQLTDWPEWEFGW